AKEAVQRLRDKQLSLRFVTNTASRTQAQILQQLADMHINVHTDELFTAATAAKAYIELQALKPYALVHHNISEDFPVFEDALIDAVLIGDAREALSYQNLNKAFRLCLQGKPLIGIGMNKYFMAEQGMQLDAGAFIHLLEFATGVKATIIGKPQPAFFQQVLASVPCKAKECLMVGDDIYGDIEGALNAGLQACLVRTGKYQKDDEARLDANFSVIDSVVQLC
ncbi:MAG: TIGR01458 family HAD-type hydrolase, partial [Pseudomonadales bacterium]|nr:TIGR01458 family HAD-type hydrolase [Pseudomonadales bacterium]